MLLKGKPLIPTATTPSSIIGGFMPQFTKFIDITSRRDGEFPHGALKREFGDATNSIRESMGEVLSLLRKHGFYPDGVNEHGMVKWKIAMKSAVQELVEATNPEYDDMSEKKLREIARRGYRRIASGGR